MSRLSLSVCILILGCATQQPAAHLSPQPYPEATHDCASIAGEYSFSGGVDIDGQPRPITFLQVQIRASRQGVQWVRITSDQGEGDFKVTLLSASDRAIGDDLPIHAHCLGGAWEQRKSVAGNSDGTWVKSDRAWRYSLGENNTLVVDVSETVVSQYLPGIDSRPRSVRNVARFPHR
jgi:hypothetical protein